MSKEWGIAKTMMNNRVSNDFTGRSTDQWGIQGYSKDFISWEDGAPHLKYMHGCTLFRNRVRHK